MDVYSEVLNVSPVRTPSFFVVLGAALTKILVISIQSSLDRLRSFLILGRVVFIGFLWVGAWSAMHFSM